MDPGPLTLRKLVWMHDGHEADVYTTQALLAGVVNRLGDGKGDTVKLKPPAWLARAQAIREAAGRAKDDLSLMRADWERFGARQAARRGE